LNEIRTFVSANIIRDVRTYISANIISPIHFYVSANNSRRYSHLCKCNYTVPFPVHIMVGGLQTALHNS